MSVEEKTKFIQAVKTRLEDLTALVNSWELESMLVGEIFIDEDTYITEYHAASYLDISQKTLGRHAKENNVPFSKEGRTTIYRIRDLREMLDKNYIKCTDKKIEDIILGHLKYAKQRNNLRANK